jgi:hypothetical protein
VWLRLGVGVHVLSVVSKLVQRVGASPKRRAGVSSRLGPFFMPLLQSAQIVHKRPIMPTEAVLCLPWVGTTDGCSG